MDSRSQTAMEYLLILGAVLLVVAVTVGLLRETSSSAAATVLENLGNWTGMMNGWRGG